MCPFFNDTYRTNLSHYQIYKSRWSLSKCLYLGSRFGLLFCWPIVMYALVFDHDEKSCKPFLVIVSVIFALLVCPSLFVTHKFTAKFINSIYHQLAVPTSMFICPPCICNHRRKTLVIGHLSALPLCRPLRHLLVFPEGHSTLETNISNIKENRVFPRQI